MGSQLSEDGDRVRDGKVSVLWWLLRGVGVSVAVVLEGPPGVIHFGKGDLAAVKGL